MIRQAARGAFVLLLIAAVLDASRAQPPMNPDKVYYRDKKDGAIRSADGELKPGPAGFQVGTGKNVIAISPGDIVRVVPGDMPPLDRKDILAQVSFEERKEWGKARDGYLELKKNAKAPPEKVNRFLEYKIAQTSARAADDAKDVESWQPQAEAAVKLLESFMVGTTSGWEVWSAARLASGLEVELGKFNEMASMWGKLANTKDAPADLRAEAGLNEIDAKFRAKRFGEVKTRADELLKTAPEGTLKRRLTIYQLAASKADTGPAEGVALVEAEIAKTQDAAIRATGYSVIGELYLAGDKPSARDAMWAFLWVEVVYNQDKDEVLTALVRLATAFAQQGDDERSKAYREKARRLRASQ